MRGDWSFHRMRHAAAPCFSRRWARSGDQAISRWTASRENQRVKTKQGRCSMRSAMICVGAAAIALWGAAATAQEFRIGFINTMSGVGATIGNHQVNGWKLGLEHEQWGKDGDALAGVP